VSKTRFAVPIAFAVVSFSIALVLSPPGAGAQQSAATLPGGLAQPAPVPAAIRNATHIFVSNAGADSGLFPSPFSGDSSRGYNQLYEGLKATGQYMLVDDPADADLVLELQLSAPNGPSNADKTKGASDPLPMFRLVIYDRKSHFVLWALTQSIDVAYKQKTHDRNFDEALGALLLEFGALSGKAAPAAR
jgi:hypothetical protein